MVTGTTRSGQFSSCEHGLILETCRRVFCAEKETQYVVSVRAFNNLGKGPVVYDLVYTSDTPAGSLVYLLIILLQCDQLFFLDFVFIITSAAFGGLLLNRNSVYICSVL